MNGKQTKKLKQIVKRAQVGNFKEFAETIDNAPFRLRLKIAVRILRKKL